MQETSLTFKRERERERDREREREREKEREKERDRESEWRLGFHPLRMIGGFEASWTRIGTMTGFLDHEGTELATRPTGDGTVFDSLSLSVSLSPSLSLSV